MSRASLAGADPLFGVDGKVVLITGGSRGIGEMIAQAFVVRGARVFITARKEKECEETAARLSRDGSCTAIAGDVSTAEGIAQIGSLLKAEADSLDVLINNAGATWGAPVDAFPTSGWDKTMDVNLKGPFFLIQQLLPMLRRSTAARILNIASIDGLRPPQFDTFAYSASKAGLIMLTRHLAKALAGENILVNAIAPGFFRTKMTNAILSDDETDIVAHIPLARLGEAADLAGMALFLASSASAYVTGATLACDGGISSLT